METSASSRPRWVDAFDAREVALLAEDLAYGILTVRSRLAQAQKVRRLREEAEKDERKRIAAILHDMVGQSMQAINLTLKRLRAMAAEGLPMPMELLDGAIAEAGSAIGQFREVSKELRPIFLDGMELVDAIRFQCRETSAHAGIEINVLALDDFLGLAERVKEQCFLSLREVLGNAARHAKADRIEVILEIPVPGRLTVKIIDDGVGFDTDKVYEKNLSPLAGFNPAWSHTITHNSPRYCVEHPGQARNRRHAVVRSTAS